MEATQDFEAAGADFVRVTITFLIPKAGRNMRELRELVRAETTHEAAPLRKSVLALGLLPGPVWRPYIQVGFGSNIRSMAAWKFRKEAADKRADEVEAELARIRLARADET